MKKLKKYLIILFSVFAFMFFTSRVSAGTIIAFQKGNNPFSSNDKSYKIRGVDETRQFSHIAVFTVKPGGENNYYEAYCVEPGVPLTSGSADGTSFDPYFDKKAYRQARRDLLMQILTFGYAAKPVSSYDSFKASISTSDYYKIVATQGLIWETVSGERLTAHHYKPDENYHDGSFYDVISNYKNSNGYAQVWAAYTTIIDSIKHTIYEHPNDVSSVSSSAPKKVMYWDGSKYVFKSNSSDYQYLSVSETSSGISASISGSTLTVTSSKPISADSPLLVTLTLKNVNANNTVSYFDVYDASHYQDVIRALKLNINYYVKVYTPKFQLKITKQSSLDNSKISGAKFDICSNSSCTKVLKSVTTATDGTASYAEVTAPGTYYVKETYVPSGYQLDSSVKSVKVSSSNVAGTSSFANITVTDKPKEFNLTKYTVDETGKKTVLDDGCTTGTYTGPEFELKDANGNTQYFVKTANGVYTLSNKSVQAATTKIQTCSGAFKVYSLTGCTYTISETKAPYGLTLPSNPTKTLNVCTSDKSVSFTNGFTGIEFQKKDEDGNYLTGGIYSLQKKIDGVYTDVLLQKISDGYYLYDSKLKESDSANSYTFTTSETQSGITLIKSISPGEYRIVEKQAPDGYDLIKDKDSTAKVTVKDNANDYYLVEMIDKKTDTKGSNASAELIVTINTGRSHPNYIVIASLLVAALAIAFILRKKMKK